jgi:hypothetical protein
MTNTVLKVVMVKRHEFFITTIASHLALSSRNKDEGHASGTVTKNNDNNNNTNSYNNSNVTVEDATTTALGVSWVSPRAKQTRTAGQIPMPVRAVTLSTTSYPTPLQQKRTKRFTHTHTHTETQIHAHTLTYAHTHTNIRTHTHTHTQGPPHAPSPPYHFCSRGAVTG